MRPGRSWCRIAPQIAVFTAAMRKLVSHTPPSDAEAKVADSWGDSAWACWHHAEEALINVVPAFLATESPYGLAAHRARAAPDQTSR
jgi:hypothetical protein